LTNGCQAPCKRRAAGCISSSSARHGGDGFPSHNATTSTGAKPGRSIGRTFGDILALGIATLNPMPKPPGHAGLDAVTRIDLHAREPIDAARAKARLKILANDFRRRPAEERLGESLHL
jgi:hypothetical protein